MTTKGVAFRKKGHKASARLGKTGLFNEAIRLFGFDDFDFSILEECQDQRSALLRERHWIAVLAPEYNILPGGKTGPIGWKHSEESRRKMRESHIGKPGPWRGKKRDPETIAKMVATRALNPVRPWLGKKRSPETVAKIIASRPFLPPPPPPTEKALAIRLDNMRQANAKRSKRVKCLYDGRIFPSIRDAARYYGVTKSPVARCCRGIVADVCGLQFAFAESP